jgi:hypothetical protein
VVAHELVHALQDQHTDLDSLIERKRGNDRQAAAQAAIEGHATLVMFALLAEEAAGQPVDPAMLPDPGAELRGGFGAGAQFPVFQRAPAIIRETLLFPYAAGASFVHALWSRDGARPHEAPIGPRLPQSTEQVMHPVARFAETRDAPTELRFAGNPAWPVAFENTLGAFEVQVLLDEHLGTDSVPADGWDGDRFRLLETPDGGRALVWVSVWDDAPAAARFTAALQRITDAGGFGEMAAIESVDAGGRHGVRLIITHDAPLSAVPRADIVCVDERGTPVECATTAES